MKKILVLLLITGVLAAVIYWVTQHDPYAAAPLTTADFAIEDTSAVGRVDITDSEGNKVSISRGENEIWMVNEKFRAREDAIDLILKTFRLIEIKHPVALNDREGILRLMAGRHTYVQVFNRNGEFIQAYYMGTMTADQRGTYMVLERPGIGRTEIPYVMTMKSFYGYLNSRFFTDELDWRDRIIVGYPDLDINRVEVHNHLHPDRSFAIEYKGGNDLSLFQLPANTPIKDFDTSRVKDYLLLYKRAGSETYDLAFEQYQIDSVLARNPDFEIIISANDPGKSKHMKMFLRPGAPGEEMDDGTPAEFDREIMYATLNGKELFRIQRFIFDAFLTPKQAFTHELDF